MHIKEAIVNQLRAFDGSLIIVALCFSMITLYTTYTLISFWMMLVQYNIDHHSVYSHFATSEEYLNALPDWVSVAYQWEMYLLLALLIWIAINLIHWIIRIIYPLWISYQKEKYPLSY
jgi:hypothetical protein